MYNLIMELHYWIIVVCHYKQLKNYHLIIFSL